MLTPFLALMMLAQLGGQPSVEGTYDGVCLYPQELRERATSGELVNCNQAEISAERISFGQRSWQSRTSFNGTFEGNRMTVNSVTNANGRSWNVRGVCEVEFANGQLSNLACSATSREVTIVANFKVSRINDPL